MERNPSREGAAVKQQGGVSPAVIVKSVLRILRRNWYWFVISLVIALGLAFLKVKKTPPVYSRNMSILVKSPESSGTESLLKEMGVSQMPVNITNEILSFNTSMSVTEVVRRLNLDMDYFRDGSFYKETVYGINLPLKLCFEALDDKETASARVVMDSARNVTLENVCRGGKTLPAPVKLSLGDTVETGLGKIAVLASPYYVKGAACDLEVVRSSISSAVSKVRSRIWAGMGDKNSSIINVHYRDVSPARAEDVLNTLFSVYNENWIRERNKRIVSTNEFIHERLQVIESELGDVDHNISNYKSQNLMPDVNQMGAMAVSQANAAEQRSTDISNQIYTIRYVQGYLNSSGDDYQLIPFNSGFSNLSISSQIAEYNTILLRRNNHLASSSAQNPIVIDLNKSLGTLRAAIMSSLDSEIELLQSQQRMIQTTRNQAVSKIASNPHQAEYLLSVERQQKVKESLYLFLLQKREENELSQAFTDYNTQLLEKPYGSSSPVEPQSKTIYLMALLIGLALPALVFLAMEMLRTTVQGKDDLKDLRTPLIGEIPLMPKNKRSSSLLVEEKNRDVVNEAFRVVRANIEFVSGYDEPCKVFMLTSFNPGSGKTMVTANLSEVFAIKGKRVLAVDLDLRRASLSEYAGKPHKGVSGYLSGREADWHPFLVKVGKTDVLPCGKIPPNPTELLYSTRFTKLLEEARGEYDYIFLDCPPVEMMADASIVNRHVDHTIFLVRAGLMDKSLLADIDEWYEQKKFKGLVALLNGSNSYGQRYGYGYSRYGYYGHYGYGYSSKAADSEENENGGNS